MGQALDRDGNVLGEAYGETRREVFDALMKDFKSAHEFRIRSLEAAERPEDDPIGLSIDMLDVDCLREWARLLLVHGADISHWASVPHVAGKMQILATNIEKAVRDIGKLREIAKLAPPTIPRTD